MSFGAANLVQVGTSGLVVYRVGLGTMSSAGRSTSQGPSP